MNRFLAYTFGIGVFIFGHTNEISLEIICAYVSIVNFYIINKSKQQ